MLVPSVGRLVNQKAGKKLAGKSKAGMRPPGLEPGTKAWKASMLTPTPRTFFRVVTDVHYDPGTPETRLGPCFFEAGPLVPYEGSMTLRAVSPPVRMLRCFFSSLVFDPPPP